MNYKECPHYEEILTILTEGRDLEDISFEIVDIQDCKECTKFNVCELWLSLTFVEDMKPQMNISDAKATIDTLDEQMMKISIELVKSIKNNNNDNDKD